MINKERRRRLGIGGENRNDKPYALPTSGKNLVTVGKGGKIQRVTMLVNPRSVKQNKFGKKVTEQPVIDYVQVGPEHEVKNE